MSNNELFINNNSQSDVDDDSSTSSTSFEQNQDVCKVQLVKDNLREQLIQPVMSRPFTQLYSDNEIDDSFELSLLRFMHLVFSKDGKIDFNNLIKYMDMNNSKCQMLYEYFMINPGVMIDYEFYYSNAGLDIRTKWFELLSNHNFLIYKKDKKELDHTQDNFFNFFEKFFPRLLLNGDNSQEKLSNIYSQLNFNFESFEVIYSTYQKIVSSTIHSNTLHYIKINGIDMYIWEMTKLKDISSGNPFVIFSNSEFRYA
jgi:hypothetical protein